MQGCVYWPGLSVRGGKCVSKDGGVCILAWFVCQGWQVCVSKDGGACILCQVHLLGCLWCEQGWRGV